MPFACNEETCGKREVLFLFDDGWRYEKKVIMRYLRNRLSFSIATHNRLTYEELRQDYDTMLLPIYSVKRHPLYALVMFFARELNTAITRRQRALWLGSRSRRTRVLHHIRECMGKIGLRRYSYADALKWLYRRSSCYDDILKDCRVLIYNPVFVEDKRILFEAHAAGIKVISWVYSWDNPFKDNEFISWANAYLVWNEENRKDVSRLHNVPPERIHVTGPAQMDYLKGRPSSPPSPPNKRYILYPCATGVEDHVLQEVEVIINLRHLIDSIDPEVELLVRPYPFRLKLETDPYACLRTRRGIAVANFGEIVDGRLLINSAVEEERYLQFRDAVCMINFGSTIGLEAAYTDTPIIQLAYSSAESSDASLSLGLVFENEHLRYIIRREYPNVVENDEALTRCLQDILSGHGERYMAYSRMLRLFSDPLGIPSYREELSQRILQLIAMWRRVEEPVQS